jgi:hypothetical protein
LSYFTHIGYKCVLYACIIRTHIPTLPEIPSGRVGSRWSRWDLGGLVRPTLPRCPSKYNFEICIIYLTEMRANRKTHQSQMKHPNKRNSATLSQYVGHAFNTVWTKRVWHVILFLSRQHQIHGLHRGAVSLARILSSVI